MALGTIVENEFVTALGGEVAPDGRVLVDGRCETSVPGMFAVGDIVAGRRGQQSSEWDEALDVADEITRRLRASRRLALRGQG